MTETTKETPMRPSDRSAEDVYGRIRGVAARSQARLDKCDEMARMESHHIDTSYDIRTGLKEALVSAVTVYAAIVQPYAKQIDELTAVLQDLQGPLHDELQRNPVKHPARWEEFGPFQRQCVILGRDRDQLGKDQLVLGEAAKLQPSPALEAVYKEVLYVYDFAGDLLNHFDPPVVRPPAATEVKPVSMAPRHDMSGIIPEFNRHIEEADPIVLECLDEAVRAFEAHCYKSSAVMLGAASEQLTLLLSAAFEGAIADGAKKARFANEAKDPSMARRFDALKRHLDGMRQAGKFKRPHHELGSGIEHDFGTILQTIRRSRNGAGHPELMRDIHADSVSRPLHLFPELAKFVYELITYFKTNPADCAFERVEKSGAPRDQARSNAETKPPDVRAFKDPAVLTDEARVRALALRAARLTHIMSGDTPAPLGPHGKLVLHLIPLASMGSSEPVDLSLWKNSPVEPFGVAGGFSARHNLDGVLSVGGVTPGNGMGYTQVFLSGAIEGASAHLWIKNPNGSKKYVHPHLIEETVIKTLHTWVPRLRACRVELPFAVTVALLGAKDAMIYDPMSEYSSFRGFETPIDRDSVLLPDVLLREDTESYPKVMRPAFDALWQSLGRPKSPLYNDAGEWIPSNYEP